VVKVFHESLTLIIMPSRLLIYLCISIILSGCHFDLQGIGTDESAISKDKGARAFFIEGMRLFDVRDFNGARREFYKIIGDYRGDSLLHEAQWMIARSYYEEGNLKDALREYRLFLKNYPESIHFREAGSVIDSIERKIAQKGEGKIVGMKLAANPEKENMTDKIAAVYRSDVNTLVFKVRARENLSADDLEPMTDVSRRYGFKLFIEIDIRDPGWIGNAGAVELAYDPVSRVSKRSMRLDLFNNEARESIMEACRSIASQHPDGIILKGYGYGKYEGVGRYIMEEFYKDFSVQADPASLFTLRPGSSDADFWRWSGWKMRKINSFLGAIIKGCREKDKSIKFAVEFHSASVYDPANALVYYSEDFLEANKYRPDYFLIVTPGDGSNLSSISRKFSSYIKNSKILFEIQADVPGGPVNMGEYYGIIFNGNGG
jgi:hypothetical protein